MEQRSEDRASVAEDAFIHAYLASFAAYHHAWSVFFVSHLGDLRRHLGDLDDALLLAAFGLGPVGDKRRAAQRNRDAAAMALGAPIATLGLTNAKRLSEVTGIPRETVRRKLERFKARGWVEQEKSGAWLLSMDAQGKARVAEALSPLHSAFLQRLARLMAEFASIERNPLP